MPSIARSEIIAVMRRTGHSARIPDALVALPEVVEVPRDSKILERLGLTLGGLMEDMGDSP